MGVEPSTPSDEVSRVHAGGEAQNAACRPTLLTALFARLGNVEVPRLRPSLLRVRATDRDLLQLRDVLVSRRSMSFIAC